MPLLKYDIVFFGDILYHSIYAAPWRVQLNKEKRGRQEAGIKAHKIFAGICVALGLLQNEDREGEGLNLQRSGKERGIKIRMNQ